LPDMRIVMRGSQPHDVDRCRQIRCSPRSTCTAQSSEAQLILTSPHLQSRLRFERLVPRYGRAHSRSLLCEELSRNGVVLPYRQVLDANAP
jgi:hypothetical protein